MAEIFSTRENWLLDAAKLQPGDTITLYPAGDLSARDAQAAIRAQYGADTLIRCWVHGNRFSCFIHADLDSRQHFDGKRKWEEDKFQQGYQARKAGKPYREDWHAWQQGWKAADAEEAK